MHGSQWISEVMHFCAGLPIILVGCKKDLRREPRVIEELRKTSQRPVTPEEVSLVMLSLSYAILTGLHRVWLLPPRLGPSTTSSAPLEQERAFVKCSNTLPVQLSLAVGRGKPRVPIASSCKEW